MTFCRPDSPTQRPPSAPVLGRHGRRRCPRIDADRSFLAGLRRGGPPTVVQKSAWRVRTGTLVAAGALPAQSPVTHNVKCQGEEVDWTRVRTVLAQAVSARSTSRGASWSERRTEALEDGCLGEVQWLPAKGRQRGDTASQPGLRTAHEGPKESRRVARDAKLVEGTQPDQQNAL